MDMSPLPFLADKIYHFLFARFESVDPYIQEQGLQWLQILTSVDVAVPFITILKAFMVGPPTPNFNSCNSSIAIATGNEVTRYDCYRTVRRY